MVKTRRLWLITLIALIWISAIAFIVEITFRLTAQYNISGIVYDDILGWRYKSNLRYRATSYSGTTYDVAINSKGFRDKKHSFSKPKDRQRIAFVGDSYTAAVHVPEENSFCRLFENMVNREQDSRYEIMNFAVSAWATDQQLLYMKTEGIRYRPDYLFLMIAPNDITESYVKRLFYLTKNSILKRGGRIAVPWFVRLGWFLSNHSCVFQFLQQKLFKTDFGSFVNIFYFIPVGLNNQDFPTWDYPLYLRDPPQEVIEAKRLFRALILEFNQLCLENECSLILVALPAKMAFDGQLKDETFNPKSAAEYLKDIAEEQNIFYLDMHSLLENEDAPLEMFLSNDYHYSIKGHNFVAEKLYDFSHYCLNKHNFR